MTKGQASYYWRLWGRVARAWNWRARQTPRPVPPLDDYPQRVVDAARLMAGDAAPTPDHYRHAVHLVALGGHKSSKDLTSRDLDKVTALMRVLVDGNDIEARFLLDNPHIAEARRLVWRARKMAPENYIDTVCRRKFQHYQSPW
jgi:hypothetical protein